MRAKDSVLQKSFLKKIGLRPKSRMVKRLQPFGGPRFILFRGLNLLKAGNYKWQEELQNCRKVMEATFWLEACRLFWG